MSDESEEILTTHYCAGCGKPMQIGGNREDNRPPYFCFKPCNPPPQLMLPPRVLQR